jgi:hypothetical protein
MREDSGIATLLELHDHKHRHVSDKGVLYEFQDAHQLLADFFAEVALVLEEIRGS